MADPGHSPVFRDVLPGGARWSHVVRRHRVLSITDLQGGANVSALFFNADLPSERYNMPDTLKAQYTAFLTRGRVLMSDMGRAMCSIVEDTCGWHDTLCGLSDAEGVDARFGKTTYQQSRNEFYRNGHDSMLIELQKWGLGMQDLVANVNFFSKVTAGEDGMLQFVTGHSTPGARVTLRAELDVLVVLATAPHPLDPATRYAPGSVELALSRGPAPTADDECRRSRPEATRSFENAERYFE